MKKLLSFIIVFIVILLSFSCSSSTSQSGRRLEGTKKARTKYLHMTSSGNLYETTPIKIQRVDTMYHIGDTLLTETGSYYLIVE